MSGEAAKGPNCSDDTQWIKIAAGLLEETEAKERMNHATRCRHCGLLLKAAVRSLSDEATPDEEAALANLGSVHSDWQAQMAQTLRKASTSKREESASSFWKSLFYWPRPAFAAVVLAVLIGAVWVGVDTLRPPSAEQLLAQAYTERRTIDVRIAGAKYAPLRVERSGTGSDFDKPGPLLKAEALISEELRQHPNDPEWLEARARAELLDGSYDDAINILQRALESKPNSPELLTDLGAAYYLRAKSTDRPIDYGNAIESLGKALAKNPDDPIALFNRALAGEKIYLYSQAVDDWEHYLRIDPQGDWADEARRRLQAIRQTIDQHKQSMAKPLLTTEQIAVATNGDNLSFEINSRIEEYLHAAITEWLPEAFPSNPHSGSNESVLSLVTLSRVLKETHGDPWLADLLDQPKGRQFPLGVKALSEAIDADDKGDYAAALKFARHASVFFLEAENPAGELRARAEEAYSDHLLWEGAACVSVLHSLSVPLRERNYGWLRSQMSLEESNCANLVGDIGTYRSAIRKGINEAQSHGYTAIFVRGLGFEALSEASLGNDTNAFSLAAKGLALFWSGHIDLTKGYNLYTDLDAAAGDRRQPNLQVALWREATELLDQDQDTLKRAMAHRWYAMAAYQAGLPRLAESEFSIAKRLFAKSPRTTATDRDYLDAEVWLARAEVLQNDLPQATKTLQSIEPALYSAPSFDPEIGYYSLAAEVAMQRADVAGTESALRSAIFLAEWGLNTLSSEDNRRRWASETRDAYRDAVEWKLREGDPTAALELWEWYKGAAARAPDREPATPMQPLETPPDARDAPPLPLLNAVSSSIPLLRDKTIITYASFPDGTAIWVYDDRGLFSYWVETSPSFLQETAAKLSQLCSDPSSDLIELRSTAHSLYSVLIKPLEERLDSHRTILFEPDGFLAAVPWDVLVDESGHYLGQQFATVVTPGVYRTKQLRITRQTEAGFPALVVSVPTALGLPQLVDAEDEARSVAHMFSGAQLLEGNEVTLLAIHRSLRGKAVFHFAGHALASAQRSGLAIAESDPITKGPRLISADSITARDASDLQLVVLSACNTSNENQIVGSGTEDIEEALLRAGVPHVIASRWKVDSVETASFMKMFYASLLAGNKVANALQVARTTLSSQPASGHPYYWSAFALQGTN